MTTFSGAPSSLSSSSVTKYQHAKSVLSLARQVAQNFESWDNRDGVDLNSSTGSIVTKFPQPVLIRSQLAGALRQGQYSSLSGSLTGNTLCASLKQSDGSGELQLTMQHTDENTQVTFKSSPRKGHDFTPGTIIVTENKATGSISIEQEQEFPWTFKYGPGVAEYEARFESSGPTSASDARLYNLGIDVEYDIRAEMERAKALDGSSVDLNPQPGLVVLAGQKPIKSDNPVDTGFLCPSPYQVPTEVCLQFEPSSGEISKYARGFGDHNAVAYERTADRQIFETNAFLGFNRVEIGADGSRLHQNFTSVERDTLKGHFRDDIEVDTSFTSRWLNPKATLGSATIGGLAAAVVSGPIGWAVGGASALAALALQKQDVQLSYGVNRFAGKDNHSQLAKAEETYKTAKGLSVGFDQAPADYESCRKFVAAHRGGENTRFEILTDKLGDSGRPALVAVPVFIAVPLQLNESGVVLPGGQIVEYSSIRGMQACRRA